MPLILSRRKILAYPAGATPGVDRSHPAAGNGSLFSGVATPGGSFCNLVSRVKGTEGGTKTSTIHSSLGPVTSYLNDGATTQDSTVFPFVTSTSGLTLAGIFNIISPPSSAAGYILNNGAGGASGIGDVGGTGRFWIAGASINNDTGVSYVLGAPYFFAASFSPATIEYVIVRLDTGETRAGSIPDVLAAGDGTITVGSRGTAVRNLNGRIAAAMASNAFMTEQQRRTWSADPWSFWYPNQAINLTNSAGAAATFLAAWARGSNLPVIGTGNY